RKALKITNNDSELKVKVLNNLGAFYFRLKNYDDSKLLFEQVVNFKEIMKENRALHAIALHNLAVIHFFTGNPSISNKLVTKSIKLKSNIAQPSIYFFNDYKLLAEIDLSENKFKVALKNILSGINTASYKKYSHPDAIIDLNKIIIHYELIDVFYIRGQIYKKLYVKTNEVNNIVLSFENYKTIYNLFDHLRKIYNGHDIKEIFSINIYHIISEAVNVVYDLYSLTGKKIDSVLTFIEKSKGMILLEELSDSDAKKISKIPKNLLSKEQNIKSQIAFYQKKIYCGLKPKEKIEYEDKLFEAKQSLDDLISKFEKDYKDYYDLKYNFKTVTPKEIQDRLSEEDTVLEYFLGEEYIYLFIITSAITEVKRIPKS
ncbi:MAG: tetratricopeptide repeat protein, partial [Romboutsia sp.]|nr:tetratricopeptide repeat protein [Romboutsia sp.]